MRSDTNVDVIDIYKLLKDNKTLDKVKAYGRVTSVIPAPKSLISDIAVDSNCVCVRVELIAINLTAYKQKLENLGIHNDNNIYFVNARMSAFVDKDIQLDDWYTLDGTLRLATRTLSPVLAMYNFYKTETNKWGIHATPTCNLDCAEIGYTSRVYEYLMTSDATGKISLPEDVLCLRQCLEDEPDRALPLVPVSNKALDGFDTTWQDMMPESVKEAIKAPPVEPISYGLDAIKPVSSLANSLSKSCAAARNSREVTFKSLRSKYTLGTDHERVSNIFDKMLQYSTRKADKFAMTGRILIKEYLSRLGVDVSQEYMGVPFYQFIMGMLDEVRDYMFSNVEVYTSAKAKRVIEEYFCDEEFFFAGILAVILGIDIHKLTDAAKYCSSNNVSFMKIVFTNPYLLLVMPLHLSFDVVELISLALGNAHNDGIRDYRNMAIVYDYMTNFSNSTCFLERDLYSNKLGLTLTKAKYSRQQTNGTHLSDYVCENIRTYIDYDLEKHPFGYPSMNWVANKGGTYFTHYLSVSEISTALDLGINLGIFVRVIVDNDKWVSTNYLAESEINIYAKLHELYQFEHEVQFEPKRIDELINKYEKIKGFTLEPEQRAAVHLLKHNVFCITGCAGSGKTTVADCIAYVVENYSEDEGYEFDLKLTAPTGRAAKRMQEVMGRPAYTLHSLFKLYITAKHRPTVDADMFMLDESGMIDISVMDNTLKTIENARVCFIGDIEQLSPIGKGLVFRNMMRFIPTVRLGVTKRSSEKSTITRNANRIVCNSEASNWADLDVGSDFSIIPCSEDKIATVTKLLCKHNLGTMTGDDKLELSSILGYSADRILLSNEGISPDDIQVVSPLEKPTYSWGCHNMNKVLHDTFNSNQQGCFIWRMSSTVQGTEFRLGDRVINCSNDYDAQHYAKCTGNTFVKVWGEGVVNGDVGKIVRLVHTSACKFEEQATPMPDDYNERSTVRDDSSFHGDDCFFVVVEFMDISTREPYYVLYRAIINKELDTYEKRVFSKGNLGNLLLFYAGTTHKLQGSQNKVIIALLGKMYYSNFITRNMIYTQITRASDKVYLVGDVGSGLYTGIGKARLNVAANGVRTWGEFICN